MSVRTRTEVTPMKLFSNERPSAMPAVLPQVAACSVLPTAHVDLVGRTAAWTVARGAAQRLDNRMRLAVSPIVGGFAGKGIDRGKYAVDGVRGVPPRGRPV